MPSSKTTSVEGATAPTKGDVTRQKVLEAAHTLFLRQGYHGTSMRQIATASGLALAGIYNHFADKDALFTAVLDAYHPYRALLEALAMDTGSSTKAEYFSRLIRRMRDILMGARADLLPLAFMDIVEFQGRHLRALAGEIMPKFLNALPPVLRMSGKLAVADVRQANLVLFANVIGFMVVRLIIGDRLADTFGGITEEEWFDTQMEVCLRGLQAPAKGARRSA